ncbi:hypothetical protein S40288_10489 [Stachybotrys chartarum IBT 40288]|nr:hypothetical protein S40288_10489 [Stachybotrys chartarum IBT 40288]
MMPSDAAPPPRAFVKLLAYIGVANHNYSTAECLASPSSRRVHGHSLRVHLFTVAQLMGKAGVAVQEGVEADLAVDLLNALDVGLRSALGAKQDVLRAG